MKRGLKLSNDGFNQMPLVQPLFFDRVEVDRFHIAFDFSNQFQSSFIQALLEGVTNVSSISKEPPLQVFGQAIDHSSVIAIAGR
jgi:hypothetical protein